MLNAKMPLNTARQVTNALELFGHIVYHRNGEASMKTLLTFHRVGVNS